MCSSDLRPHGRRVADRVAVMYLGRIVETATNMELFERPQHPYTVSLLSAVPVPDPARRSQRIVLDGELPSPVDPPDGCAFHPRCPLAEDRCRSETPLLLSAGESGARVACHRPGEMAQKDT